MDDVQDVSCGEPDGRSISISYQDGDVGVVRRGGPGGPLLRAAWLGSRDRSRVQPGRRDRLGTEADDNRGARLSSAVILASSASCRPTPRSPARRPRSGRTDSCSAGWDPPTSPCTGPTQHGHERRPAQRAIVITLPTKPTTKTTAVTSRATNPLASDSAFRVGIVPDHASNHNGSAKYGPDTGKDQDDRICEGYQSSPSTVGRARPRL